MAKKIFWLNCPFDEKDMCKNLGGRWDNDRRKWFVLSELDPDQFKRWWPSNLTDTKPTLTIVENN